MSWIDSKIQGTSRKIVSNSQKNDRTTERLIDLLRQDADTLCQMLTYDSAPASEQKMHPISYTHCTFNEQSTASISSCTLYDPPIEEFSVLKTVLEESGTSAAFDPLRGPTIIICTKGDGTIKIGETKEQVKAGWVFFVGAETGYVLRNTGTAVLVAYQAFCDVRACLTPDDTVSNISQ
jgi:mannose-6-phosphate isomerase